MIEANGFRHSSAVGLELERYQWCCDEIRTTICHCVNEQTASSSHRYTQGLRYSTELK